MKRFSTKGLARMSARNPWRVVGAWLILLALSFYLIFNYLGSALTNGMTFAKELESDKARKVLESKLNVPDKITETILVKSESQTVDDADFRTLTEKIYKDTIRLKDNVEKGITYYIFPDPSLVSKDKHKTIIVLTMTGGEAEAVDNAKAVRKILDENKKDGFEVGMAGQGSINADTNRIAEETFQKAEIFGIPLAFVVMVAVFGTLVAAFVPLIIAAFAIITALGITAIVGQKFGLTFYIINMILMMGLAVGIDYALFIVSRFREERRKGLDKVDAITKTGSTASHAVFFSGLVVLIALAGLMIVPMSIFMSLSAGAIFVVTMAIVSILTLLPAILSILGDRVNSLKLPFIKRESIGADKRGGFWDKMSGAVMKHPVISVVLTAGLLIALTIPAFHIKTGAAGIDSIPDSLPSVKAYKDIQKEFSLGISPPLHIVINGNANSEKVKKGLGELENKLKEKSDIYGKPEKYRTNGKGDTGVLVVPLFKDANTQEATREVKDLRNNIIPDSFKDSEIEVLVGGAAAQNLDYFELTDQYRPIVFAFVLGLSFILLMLVFRSLVVPAKAIVMNLLSVGATYGLLVLVFQEGYGSKIFGFGKVEAIDAWVPLFLFAVLFGLSMDYHVFLLSRIRERFMYTGDNTESVTFGLRSTGKIITGAALIMLAVFAGFATGDLVMFQQMGFGLAVAVLLDATIIRSVLVPASMKLLGKWNWYLPGWLKWLPELHVEGGEKAAERTFKK